ncbi:MAG: type IX secretion system protein PorQ [Flavobacteriales bacterium]|nr:type IX secretion system protein PorQ [Flavobacteriales bacterium]MDW8431979.1 type IX secretion system protein PorQ [Flavobacteriales bacterium]
MGRPHRFCKVINFVPGKQGVGLSFVNFFFIIFLWVWLLPAGAQIGGSAVFMENLLPGSARVEALGGRVNSLFEKDPGLVWHNPALNNAGQHRMASLGLTSYFAGITAGQLAYSHSLDSAWHLHGALRFLNYGKFEGYDEFGNFTGAFGVATYGLNLSVAHTLARRFQMGLGLKMYYGQAAALTSLAMGLDMGILYVSADRLFTTTLQACDIGLQLKTFDRAQREPLPFRINAGASVRFPRVPLRLHTMIHNLQKPDLSYTDPLLASETDISGQLVYRPPSLGNKILRHFVFGAELMPFKGVVQARLGYNFQRRFEMKARSRGALVGLTWGLGLRIQRFELQYARGAYHLAGSPNTFTLNIDLKKRPPRSREKRKASEQARP